MNNFRHFVRIPWMRDQFDATPVPTQDGTTHKNAAIL